jgi:hypothetical protein
MGIEDCLQGLRHLNWFKKEMMRKVKKTRLAC